MHKKLVEAALFMSTRPLGLDELAKLIGVNSLGFVKQVMEELREEYRESGLEIVNTPEGWTMQVKQEFLPKIAHLTPYHDLSEGTKRALAIIVYREPVKQSEVIKIQGNKAYSYIKELVKKGLVRTEKDGRTKTLYLTPEFERYFGEERTRIKERMDMQLQEAQKESIQEMPRQVTTEMPQNPEEPVVQDAGEETPEFPKTDEQNGEPIIKSESEKIKSIREKQSSKKFPVKESGEIRFEDLKRKKK